MEVWMKMCRGETPLQDLKTQTTSDNLDSPTSPSSPLSSPLHHHTCPPVNVPSGTVPETPQARVVLYLAECYARVAIEERNHPKVSPNFNVNYINSYEFCDITGQHRGCITFLLMTPLKISDFR